MSSATSEKAPCCCDPCCRDILIPADIAALPPVEGSVLVAELLYDGVGCFEIGATQELVDTTSSIWVSTAGFMGNSAWRELQFSCGTLSWIGAGCPLNDTATILWHWKLVSRSCIPFIFTFEYLVDEDDPAQPGNVGGGCSACNGTTGGPGLSGLLRVKITIKP